MRYFDEAIKQAILRAGFKAMSAVQDQRRYHQFTPATGFGEYEVVIDCAADWREWAVNEERRIFDARSHRQQLPCPSDGYHRFSIYTTITGG